MDHQLQPSTLRQILRHWPLFLIGAGLIINLAWIVLWGWLLCRAMTILAWPLYQAVLAALG